MTDDYVTGYNEGLRAGYDKGTTDCQSKLDSLERQLKMKRDDWLEVCKENDALQARLDLDQVRLAFAKIDDLLVEALGSVRPNVVERRDSNV